MHMVNMLVRFMPLPIIVTIGNSFCKEHMVTHNLISCLLVMLQSLVAAVLINKNSFYFVSLLLFGAAWFTKGV